MLEIVLTREDANSESALLVEWAVADREPVKKGQVVCTVETSKSAIEIESPGDGTLCHFAKEGDTVDMGARIAVVAETAEELAAVEVPAERPAEAESAGPANVTRKAAELAAAHDIDLSEIRKDGFITVDDVEALIAAAGGGGGGALAGISLSGVTLPAVYEEDDPAVGVLDQGFLASLRSDPGSFAALSSDEKVERYRAAGAVIGENVRFGDGAVVLAGRIVFGDDIELGAGSRIECAEVVAIGSLSRFRAGFLLSCRRAYIGAGAHVGSAVRIGGGSSGDPQAALVVGDLAYIGDEAFLNTGRPVVIGREVFITMRSVLVTHNIGHSILEGFENRFAPIVLEDRAQIGIGAVVYAGCRVGREAIVASNSYVVTDIPAGKLAIGVPARATADAAHPLSGARVWDVARSTVDDLYEALQLRGVAVSRTDGGFEVEVDGKRSQVILVDKLDGSFAAPAVDGETVVLAMSVEGDAPAGVAVADLIGKRIHGEGGVLLESVREFYRKRGIRFEPGPWRYSGGLL